MDKILVAGKFEDIDMAWFWGSSCTSDWKGRQLYATAIWCLLGTLISDQNEHTQL
jgi:hypothetical protein